MADLMSPPAWKSLQSRRAAAKMLSRLPRRAAAAPPHLSSLRRRAVSGSTRRVPRVLGRILRVHQRCGRSPAANVAECAGAVGVVRAEAALEPSGPGT